MDGRASGERRTGVRIIAEDDPEDAAVLAAGGYRRRKPVERPKLGPWLGLIDQILVDDQRELALDMMKTLKRSSGRLVVFLGDRAVLVPAETEIEGQLVGNP